MNWADSYRRRITSADEAVRAVRSRDHVWIHAGCNNPEELIRALVARHGELQGVEIAHLMTFGCADHVLPRYQGSFRHRGLFLGANVREAVNAGRKVLPHDFEEPKYFESCMPIEVMAERGHETLRFGPMRPIGLRDPRTGHRPWAVVQLRPENKYLTAYNLVGFQTRLAYPEQQRIFQMILDTASGKRSKSEEFGYGEDEFAPWHFGATM